MTAGGAVVLLAGRLGGLTRSSGQLYESSLFVEDFTSFVDLNPVLDSEAPVRESPTGFGLLTAEDVSFTYPSRSEPSLRGTSIEIHAGEVVALVGANGSGKTTLTKILAGLYEPTSGTIRWDGVDVREIDPDGLRRSISIMFQDFVRYQLTAAENISMGSTSDSEGFGQIDDDLAEAVVDAARAAGAHELISALPNGYGSRLGPTFLGGVDLSLGQWQRLALARALYRDTPFVILDEPTAALDARAELDLFERARSAFSGRAVLLISHRFATVRSADRIYVLDDGRVIEHGSHDELIELGGTYAELFTIQASSYLDVR